MSRLNQRHLASSVYLRQHAHQAIDWYAWGSEPFELARITNKPVFLSVGCASCYGCDVMRRSIFDRDDVAKRLNDAVVAIKVDRHERPDIDHVYMAATQLLTNRSGWPNLVFCLPTGQPFHAMGYLPADDDGDTPGFLSVFDQLMVAWQNRRDDIDQQAQEIERVIKQMNTLVYDANRLRHVRDDFERVCVTLKESLDLDHNRPSSRPSFCALRFRLITADASDWPMIQSTVDAMAKDRGYGIGSRSASNHPYNMLSDHAQMIELYSIMQAQSANGSYGQVVTHIIHHLVQTWGRKAGGFCLGMVGCRDGAVMVDAPFSVASNARLARALFMAAQAFDCSAWFDMAESLLEYGLTQLMDTLDDAYANDVVYTMAALLVAPVSLATDDALKTLWGVLMNEFYDHAQTGLWLSQGHHATPISRIKEMADGDEPSPNGVFIGVALALAQRWSDPMYYQIAVDTLMAFFPMVMEAPEGCATYWEQLWAYWQSMMPKTHTVQVQWAVAKPVSSHIVDVMLDMTITDYLMGDAPLTIHNDDAARWLSYRVDPVQSRRFGDDIARCATGRIRVSGHLERSRLTDTLDVTLPQCGEDGKIHNTVLSIPVFSGAYGSPSCDESSS